MCNELHRFLDDYSGLECVVLYVCFCLFGWSFILQSWFWVVLWLYGFIVYFLTKNLELGQGKEGEMIWKVLRGGKNMIKLYLKLNIVLSNKIYNHKWENLCQEQIRRVSQQVYQLNFYTYEHVCACITSKPHVSTRIYKNTWKEKES